MVRNLPSLNFVVPDDTALVSGGHLYNRRVRQALADRGWNAPALGLPEFADAVERRQSGVFLVDTIHFPGLASIPFEDVDAHLLVHHLASLAPVSAATVLRATVLRGADDVAGSVANASDAVFAAVEAPLLRRFHGFVATSPFTASYLVDRGFDAGTVVVAPPAVEGFAALADPRARSEGPLRVLLVGNLEDRKGIHPFLEALGSLPAGVVAGLEVRIAGGHDADADYADMCVTAVERCGLGAQVEFAGLVPPTAMADFYRWADVFVSAASMETFGMALQEAVACRVPVFAIAAGYVSEHVADGVSGRLFADIESLVAALVRLAGDPAELQSFRAGAAARSPQGVSSWGQTAQLMIDAFGRGD